MEKLKKICTVFLEKCLEIGTGLINFQRKVILTQFRLVPNLKLEKVGRKRPTGHISPMVKSFFSISAIEVWSP
jgi:hypothetical protein